MDDRHWLLEIGAINRPTAETVEQLVQRDLGLETTVELIDPRSSFGRALDVHSVNSAVAAFSSALDAGTLSADDTQIVTGLLSDMTTWLDREYDPEPDTSPRPQSD